jgi:cytochrome c553
MRGDTAAAPRAGAAPVVPRAGAAPVVPRAGAAALAAALLLLAPLPALAAGDIEAGRQKAQVCQACHGPEGKSVNPLVPILAGQPAQAVVTQLFQFREGKRKNEVMSPFALKLSNTDLNDLAAYFSAQKAPPPAHKSDPAKVAAGQRLTVEYNCVACHTATLVGQQQMPRLAGQQLEYLRTQLTLFRAQQRSDMDGNMTSAAQVLTPQDIDAITDYLAGLDQP